MIGRFTNIAGIEDPDLGIKRLKIKRWSTDNRGRGSGDLKIGSFCCLGKNITIYLGGNHNIDCITTFPFGHIFKKQFPCSNRDEPFINHSKTNGDVIINDDVWIADNCTIMSGVTIGSGAIVANNSHVVKDVLPYEIVGGNPAKHIKYRFDSNTIKLLLDLKWWDFPIEQIVIISKYLCAPLDDIILKWIKTNIKN